MSNIEEVAKELTEAQRQCLLAIRPGEERRAIDFSGSSARGLRKATGRRPALLSVTITGAGTVAWYRHTRDGLAVRAHLLAKEGR